jgi:hypothetical protein
MSFFRHASLALVLILVGCSGSSSDDSTGADSSDLTGRGDPFSRSMTIIGDLAYGQTSSPTPYHAPPRYIGFTFTGKANDAIQIDVTSASVRRSPLAFLLAPVGTPNRSLTSAAGDPTGDNTAHIDFTLPSDGQFTIAVREAASHKVANFTVKLTGPPPPPPPLTFATSRIAQADIDNGQFTAQQLFDIGKFLFVHTYTVDEGLGNALTPPLAGPNPRPNSRKIHNGKFGGPDSTDCKSCHSVGGHDGGGDLDHNLLQDGDGANMSTVLVRQPIALLGVGYVQQLGIEMTQDLQSQLQSAQQSASDLQADQTVQLSSKGTNFGSITAKVDGTVDFSQLTGVDKDLVVRPLGWKGRVDSLRRFVEGGFQVHLGMATQPLIAKHCKTPIPAVVGNGPDCTDPDNDGVKDEITEGQLTAMAIYASLLEVPIRIPPTDPTALQRAQNGEANFNSVGCTNCHTQSLTLNSPIHDEAPDLTGGTPFEEDLTVDVQNVRLSADFDGTVNVELWSDLARHDMGPALADPHATFGSFAANLWLTPPLWGVASSPPYLHDGRAATLQDAILAHDGEAASVKAAFLALSADDQAQLVEFLQTLSRTPPKQ